MDTNPILVHVNTFIFNNDIFIFNYKYNLYLLWKIWKIQKYSIENLKFSVITRIITVFYLGPIFRVFSYCESILFCFRKLGLFYTPICTLFFSI